MSKIVTQTLLGSGFIAAAFWLGFGGSTVATQPTVSPLAATGDRQPDRDAIRKMMGEFAAAFQSHDAAAAVSFMTNEAELIPDEGDPLKGKDAIQKAYSTSFAKTAKPTFKVNVEHLRFPSRDTALEDGTLTVTRDGDSETHRYHILYAREDGKWLISIIKEWPEETTELDDLNWLIGTWYAKVGDGEVTNSYEWMGNKAFIKASIQVRGKERSFTAMQIIGLDPDTGTLRTWTFENDGGIGEGSITQDGSNWIFENATTLGGGGRLETSNILVVVNRDTITWQSVNLAINGESIGDLPPTKLTRVKK